MPENQIRFSTQVKTGSFDLGLFKPVKAASTADIDLTTGGLLTIDGVVVAANDRVLVKNQTVASQNGIYLAASGAWARADDLSESAEIRSGSLVTIQEGTSQADTIWMLTTDAASPVIGTTSLSFVNSAVAASEVFLRTQFIFAETPSGAIDGSNVTFTLANTPFSNASVHLHKNGQRLRQGAGNDYTISGVTITMASAPRSSPGNPDHLEADYIAQ